MHTKTITPLVLCMFLLVVACHENQQKSRVVYFEYGSYEDSVHAILHGIIVEEIPGHAIGTDSLKNLPGAQISIDGNVAGFQKSYITDADGKFTISFPEGTYNFTVQKEGYQTLHVTNFVADIEHAATTKIILEKE